MEYSKIAKSYNELYSKEQINKLKIIKRILKIEKHHKMLDVGCGTGISTYFFEETCYVKGIDPCKELITQGKGDLIQASAENIPFSENDFDIVISVTAIHNFQDIDRGIKEIKRVLKPGGQIAFSILKRSPKFNKIKKIIKEYFPEVKTLEEEKDIIFYRI